MNWAPWSFAADAVAGQALGDGPVLPDVGTAGLISVAGATLAARSTDRVVNGVGMASCFAVGQLFVRQIRNGARRLEAARAAAVEEGRVLAAERERSRQLRLLHDDALQTLETVGSRTLRRPRRGPDAGAWGGAAPQRRVGGNHGPRGHIRRGDQHVDHGSTATSGSRSSCRSTVPSSPPPGSAKRCRTPPMRHSPTCANMPVSPGRW